MSWNFEFNKCEWQWDDFGYNQNIHCIDKSEAFFIFPNSYKRSFCGKHGEEYYLNFKISNCRKLSREEVIIIAALE